MSQEIVSYNRSSQKYDFAQPHLVTETYYVTNATHVPPAIIITRQTWSGSAREEHEHPVERPRPAAVSTRVRPTRFPKGTGEVVRHEPPRHLRVGLFLGVVLCAPEIPQVLSSAAHGSARAGPRFLGTRPSSTGRQGSREFSDDPAVAGRPYLRIAYHLYDRFGRSSGEMSV